MRRALVLSDETARHSFLASLPPHIRQPIKPDTHEAPRWRLTARDVREFLMAYCACFMAASVFIG